MSEGSLSAGDAEEDALEMEGEAEIDIGSFLTQLVMRSDFMEKRVGAQIQRREVDRLTSHCQTVVCGLFSDGDPLRVKPHSSEVDCMQRCVARFVDTQKIVGRRYLPREQARLQTAAAHKRKEARNNQE